jgi:hypothetical protein
LRQGPFGDLNVASKSILFQLKSYFGKSQLRDKYLTTGAGAVLNTVGDAEFTLQVTGATDTAILQSVERGSYVAGLGVEIGIAVRIPNTTPLGNQVYQWGLFDARNGMFFQLSSSGFAVVIRRDSLDTIIPEASFNGDFSNFNLSNGYIYNIEFSWYGYGAIKFKIYNPQINSKEEPFKVIHTYVPIGQTSVKCPNLPLTASIINNGTNATGIMFVGGRQYSIIGQQPTFATRLNSAYRIDYPVNTTESFVPVMAIRKKSAYNFARIAIQDLQLVASSTIIVHIIASPTLTGAVYTNIPEQNSTETAIEFDRATTEYSGGIIIYSTIVTADKSVLVSHKDLNYILNDTDPVILAAKALNITNGNMTCLLRWSEEW